MAGIITTSTLSTVGFSALHFTHFISFIVYNVCLCVSVSECVQSVVMIMIMVMMMMLMEGKDNPRLILLNVDLIKDGL